MQYKAELGVPQYATTIDSVFSNHISAREHIYTIQDDSKESYTSELLDVCTLRYEEDKIDQYITKLRNTSFFSHLSQKLPNIKKNKLGIFLIKNIPVDQVCRYFKKSTSITEMILLLSSTILGEPYGFAFRQNEAVIQDVFPRKENIEDQLNGGSNELLWHTEDAHTNFNPDYIALVCLRSDQEAQTFVSCVEPSYFKLDNAKLLLDKYYTVYPDSAFLHRRCQLKSILSHDKDSFYLYFDPLYTECSSPEAAKALIDLNHYINSRSVSICLEHGDLLIIDNRRAVHARSKYRPRFDGLDRWLQRIFIFSKSIPQDALLYSNKRLIVT